MRFIWLLLLLPITTLQAQVKQQVLVEHFTNSNCSICGFRNGGFRTNLSNHPDALHVSIHPSRPYADCALHKAAPAENDARTKYYGIFGSTPRLVINGKVIDAGQDYAASALFDPFEDRESPFSIEFTREWDASKWMLHIEAVVRVEAQHSYDELLFFGIQAEDTVEYKGRNSETVHYNVLRNVFLGNNGIKRTAKKNIGDTMRLSLDIGITEQVFAERTSEYLIIQDPLSKLHIQSAKSAEVGQPVGIADFNKLEVDINLATGLLTNTGKSPVNYSIYDLTGRERLKGQIFQSGKINMNDLSKGIYFLRMQQANKQQVIRFIRS